MAFKNFYLKIIPNQTPTQNIRISVKIEPKMEILHRTFSEDDRKKYTNTPRTNPIIKALMVTDTAKFFPTANYSYNPLFFTVSLGKQNVYDVKGIITELGAPVLDRRVLVVLLTSNGEVVDKVYTDLEGNFVFYEIPQNLSLMAVAIDNTYKYNATILSKILTVDNGE